MGSIPEVYFFMVHNRSFYVGNGELQILLYIMSSTQQKTHFKQQKCKLACLNNYRKCSYGLHLTRLFRPGAAICMTSVFVSNARVLCQPALYFW